MSFLRTFFTNRFGLVGVAANMALLIVGLFEKGFGDRTFHFYYEPLSIKIFVFLNIPAIFASDLLTVALYPTKATSSMIVISNFEFFTTVVFSILQWLLFGCLLALSLQQNRATVS